MAERGRFLRDLGISVTAGLITAGFTSVIAPDVAIRVGLGVAGSALGISMVDTFATRLVSQEAPPHEERRVRPLLGKLMSHFGVLVGGALAVIGMRSLLGSI